MQQTSTARQHQPSYLSNPAKDKDCASMCQNLLKSNVGLQAVFLGRKTQRQQRQHAEVAAAAQIHQMQRRIMAAVALAWSQIPQHRKRERALLAHAQQKTQRKMLVHCLHTLKHYACFHIDLNARLQAFLVRCNAPKLQTAFQAWLGMAQYRRWRHYSCSGSGKGHEDRNGTCLQCLEKSCLLYAQCSPIRPPETAA